jgi:cytochrome c556
MKFATAPAVAAVAAATFGAMAVIAQQDPVTTRENLMKENDQHARTLVRMMRGQRPFDAAAIETAFAQWADTAKRLPGLFPENSQVGGDNRASPTIWLDKDDFDTRAVAFGKTVAENRDKAKATLDGLKAAVSAVGKQCDHCHEDYRLAKR